MNSEHANRRLNPRRLILPSLILALISLSSVLMCQKTERTRTQKLLEVVTVVLGPGTEICPVLATPHHPHRTEQFSTMVKRLHPYAAINGTFYSDRLVPLGDVLIDGKLVIHGKYPNAIAMSKNGKIELVRRKGDNFDWRGYRCALASGPRLVHRGKVNITPIADGFSDMSLVIRAPRSAVGFNASGNLMLVVCPKAVSLTQFAVALRDTGAVEAMNLDGGPACGLYSNGKILVNATLPMTNLLVVYKR